MVNITNSCHLCASLRTCSSRVLTSAQVQIDFKGSKWSIQMIKSTLTSSRWKIRNVKLTSFSKICDKHHTFMSSLGFCKNILQPRPNLVPSANRLWRVKMVGTNHEINLSFIELEDSKRQTYVIFGNVWQTSQIHVIFELQWEHALAAS